MSLTISITQPTYLPWLGYFDLINRSDVFVILDTVHFQKQSWQSRNRIRTSDGSIQWISVPISRKSANKHISEIEIAINPNTWRKKHTLTIQHNLGSAPFYGEIIEIIDTVVTSGSQPYLADLNYDFIVSVVNSLNINTEIVRLSELEIHGTRVELLINICRNFGARTFYCNAGSASYLENDRHKFYEQGLEIQYQNWFHPKYIQMGDGFVSHLSCLDALACVGANRVEEFIKGTDPKEK